MSPVVTRLGDMMPLDIIGVPTLLHRCRDCAGYADPTATHADCTITHARKAGYAGACRRRVERGGAIPIITRHVCVECGADIAHKRREARRCDECAVAYRDHRKHAGRVEKP
jgi:hypothetical protein